MSVEGGDFGSAPAPDQFRTNDEIYDAWLRTISIGKKPSTVHRYKVAVREFLDALDELGGLPRDLTPAQILKWFETRRTTRWCKWQNRNRFGRGGWQCDLGLPDVPSNCHPDRCKSFQSIAPSSTENKIDGVNSLYQFLVTTGHVQANLASPVKKQFRELHGKALRRSTDGYVPTTNELKQLIDGSQIRRKMLYALLAKGGLRLHEAFLIHTDPAHMNLDEGWFKLKEFQIGNTSMTEGKREGNPYIAIDKELRTLLERYFDHRDRRHRPGPHKDAYGRDVTHQLLINQRGEPLNSRWMTTHNEALWTDLVRCGLNTEPEPGQRRPGYGERITFHSFRYFFSNALDRNGAPGRDYRFLRGDTLGGTEDIYLKRAKEITPEKYALYGPKIGFRYFS